MTTEDIHARVFAFESEAPAYSERAEGGLDDFYAAFPYGK